MYEHGKGRNIGLKVVLDTNVYVSIFNWPASPLAELWRHARKGTYELLVSPAIIDEVGATLRGEKLSWDNNKILHRLKLVIRVGKIVVPESIPNVIPEDPPDNHIFACAIAGKAKTSLSPETSTSCAEGAMKASAL